MSDLRTRIAAVLAEAQETHNGISDLDLADAVIAVLNESATECWDQWPARRCLILGTVNND